MGLIKTALETAVAVKTAHVVHDRIERRKQEQWVAQGHAPEAFPPTMGGLTGLPPPGTAGPMPDVLAQLRELGELKQAGILTAVEFETQKQRILTA